MADCAACGKPVPDVAYVCHPCAYRDDKQPLGLAPRLRHAAELWPELETTITRQARMAEPGPRARGHAPPQPIRPGLGDPAQDHQLGSPAGLPFAWAAADVRDVVRNVVTTWARVVLEERGGVGPTDGYTENVMRWLASQLGWYVSPTDPRGLTVRGTRELLAAGPLERRVLAMQWLRCARCGGVEIDG